MATEISKQAYSVPEFAKALGLSRAHVYNLVARGEVPTIKLGHRLIVPGWYVEQLLGKPEQGLPPSA